ncbi:MAG: radical SAM protein [Candidatus Aenigmatarchaeota archaeon]
MIEKEIIEKLSKWVEGKKAAPHKVHLYPTNRCNLRCPFCYQQLNPYDYSDTMSKEKWISIVRELCEMSVNVIRISGGGEPMMIPEKTLPMMREAKKYDVTGRMTTNGTLFNEKNISKIVDMNWDHMVFSVDGPDAKTHDFHRGRTGTFERVTKNIKTFNKIKENKNKKTPKLEFSSVLSKKNWGKVPEIIELANKLDVEVITFEPLFVSNPSVKKLKMSKTERKKFVEKAEKWKKLADSYNIFTNIDTVINIGEIEKTGSLKDKIIEISETKSTKNSGSILDVPCYEPWLWPKIEANGQVGPCSTNLLDVNIKNKTFEEIWFGEEFKMFRKMIKNRNLPSGCENCVSTHIVLNEEIKEKLLD